MTLKLSETQRHLINLVLGSTLNRVQASRIAAGLEPFDRLLIEACRKWQLIQPMRNTKDDFELTELGWLEATRTPDPAELLAELETSTDRHDAIMRRALIALRDMISDREQIEAIARQAHIAHAASTAAIVELACAFKEHETGTPLLHLMGARRLAS